MQPRRDARGGWPLACLLLVALAAYAWNLATQKPFVGYDVEGHMHYAATLVDESRLPHPLEGWSTFHPPLYYLLVALVSRATAPVWPAHLLEAISSVAMLLTGTLAFGAARALGHPRTPALVASALLLFAPFARLAATMVGNEALGAACCALAAAGGVRLHAEPRSLRWSAATGLGLGLALATKFTGVFAAPALLVPFLRDRRDGWDRRRLGAAALGVCLALLIGGAPYLRNLALTGSPLPMTRDREPVASVERSLTIRERRATDYLWLDPRIVAAPVVHRLEPRGGLNPIMTNVWGLLYASAWYDAHEVRVGEAERVSAARAGSVLLLLGLAPTALLLLGAALSLRDLLRNGLAEPSAPLTAMAGVGCLGFVAFTARAPAAPAVKASYLLPLAVPGVVFFARGAAALGRRARRGCLAASGLAAIAAAALFSNGVILPVQTREVRTPPPWMTPGALQVAAELEAASAGRWLGVTAEPGPGSGVTWRLLARSYPALRDDEVGIWCGYVARAMSTHAPGLPWRTLVTQGADVRRCSGARAAPPGG